VEGKGGGGAFRLTKKSNRQGLNEKTTVPEKNSRWKKGGTLGAHVPAKCEEQS